MKRITLIAVLLASQFSFAELRDPTRPPPNINQAAETPIVFELTAIIIANDRKIAVINGANKKIGDEILGEIVTNINENAVQLEGSNGKITLYLLGKPVKQLPNRM